jgi:hypothetical protein
MRPIRARSRNPMRSGRFAAVSSFDGRFDDRNAVEQRAGLVGRKDRRLAFFDDVFRTAHGVGRVDVDHMPGDKPVEQHAKRGQVLLDGGRREFVLQVFNESGDMERLDARELVDVLARAPGGEAPGGVHIGSAGVVVVDLGREKLKDTLRGLRRGRKERRRPEIR